MTTETPAAQSAVTRGLTAAEVADRIRRGQVNRTRESHLAEYWAIVSRNLFTLFNLMVTPAAIALFYLGKYQAAIAVSGMAIVNTTLALVQEIRAKWHLDRLAILVEARVRVWRDGQLIEIPASDVVLGDHIQLSAGDTIVADGEVLEDRFLEVDEALLTGESDPVRRKVGDWLLSGSFCVAGEGVYRADRVGPEAFAQKTSAEARRYRFTSSPITRQINVIIHVLTWTTVVLSAAYITLYLLSQVAQDETVLMIAATVTSMVPQGLVLTATMSFTLGAVVMSRRGAIVQRLNAVETMAGIDVICTDKTGTLTTNRLELDAIYRLAGDVDDEEVRRAVRLFASATLDRKNKTVLALLKALGEEKAQLIDQIPFKSQNRYSAVRVRDGAAERVLVLGAPEALWGRTTASRERQRSEFSPASRERQRPEISPASRERQRPEFSPASRECQRPEFSPASRERQRPEIEDPPYLASELQRQGLRTLLFCEAERGDVVLADSDELPDVPLRPLALIALRDELRPDAEQVLEALYAQGIAFKVVSGDNPNTVKATVGHLKLPLASEPVVTGDELAKAPDKDELIATRSVFGRVAPAQKVEIVEALQRRGHLVSMIGDGVNDVLPIKKADLGIAMGDGAQASKTVAGLVLENNDFALLPETLEEGRTILRNLRRSGKLFLTKNVYSLVFILVYASGLLGLPFPYLPQQVTLLNWLVIGIPAFIIAITRERSGSATKTHYLKEISWFALRTGIIFAAAGLMVLTLSVHVWQDDERTQRTLLLSTLILLGITALLRALTDGEIQPLKGDIKFRWLAAAAVPAYLLAMYVPFSARFFELTPLLPVDWLRVLAVVIPAWLLTLASDRLVPPRGLRAAGSGR